MAENPSTKYTSPLGEDGGGDFYKLRDICGFARGVASDLKKNTSAKSMRDALIFSELHVFVMLCRILRW